MLEDVQGNNDPGQRAEALRYYDMEFGTDQYVKNAIGFVDGPIKQPILSLGKLIKQGQGLEVGKDVGFLYLRAQKGQVVMRSNSLYMNARIVDEETVKGEAGSVVALVEVEQSEVFDEAGQEEIAARSADTTVQADVEDVDDWPVVYQGSVMHPKLSVDTMRRRLTELREPVWGTKDRLWMRLKAAESWGQKRKAEMAARRQMECDLTKHAGEAGPLEMQSPQPRRGHDTTSPTCRCRVGAGNAREAVAGTCLILRHIRTLNKFAGQ